MLKFLAKKRASKKKKKKMDEDENEGVEDKKEKVC